MGKAGRFACILTPMVLSIASLICLLVVFLGGLNKGDPNLRSLYYFKADTSQFKADPTAGVDLLKGVSIDNKLLDALKLSASSNNLKDFYEIYMWNYCWGSKTNGTKLANGTMSSGTETITDCSPRKAQFYFDPIQEWGLNGTIAQDLVPKAITGALNTYKKVAQWMFVAYAIAFWTTVASVVVGIFAIFSRVGSCITTVVASVAALFTFVAALTSTILFSTLVGAMGTALKPYKVKLTIGTKMMALDWVAVVFSIGASMFWLVSICCCSGRSNHPKKSARESSQGAGYAGFGSRGYQPLAEQGHDHRAQPSPAPFGAPGQKGMEMQDFGSAGPYKGRETAYEPFRHERV